MAQHYPEIIGIILLLTFAATMFYQGTMIMKGYRGYTHMDHEKQKMIDMRRRIEELMSKDDD
jgi:ABC-type nickel/cobalt efflux system permease component RcnA